MKKKSYYDALYINRYNLAEELSRQPQLFMDWALTYVYCMDITEKAKDFWERTKAKADEEIRADPEKFGLEENPKETAIKYAVDRHRKVRKARRTYLRKKREENEMKKAMEAFQQRKNMLESLSSVNTQLHFAEPSLPRDQQRMVEKHRTKKLRRKLKGQMK